MIQVRPLEFSVSDQAWVGFQLCGNSSESWVMGWAAMREILAIGLPGSGTEIPSGLQLRQIKPASLSPQNQICGLLQIA
jgi:hypothetical protein